MARNTIWARYARCSIGGRGDVVVRVAHVWREEQHRAIDEQERADCSLLGDEIGMEGNGIALALHFHTGPVRRTRDMQRPDMQHDDADDDERQQVVQREEAVQRGIIGCETAKQPCLQRLADERYGAEQAGDDLGAPEARPQEAHNP